MKTLAPKSKQKAGQQNQVSLMHVFREAARQKDAEKADNTVTDGERQLSTRAKQRRLGADQTSLRAHLNEDLSNLMHTIRLEAAMDLDQHKYVGKSVLNFGMDDMANMSANIHNRGALELRLRKALLDHEPRLIRESVQVTMRDDDHEMTQKIAFHIEAEMAANPVDVPLEFTAEIDVGSGNVQMANLKVNR